MSARINLRPMRPDEFDTYMEARDREYVQSLTATMSPDAAWQKAKADRQRFLPQGIATEGNRLLFAENSDGVVVGSVWLGLTDPRTGSSESAWLFDIRVEPAHRRAGYATAMLRAVESLVRGLGLDQLALNVFGTNAAAIALYETAGYRVATQQMLKTLRDPDER
jgi:RimJ/RimL family protein N-acetyltransferase